MAIKKRLDQADVSDNEKSRADTFIKTFAQEEYSHSRFYGKEISGGGLLDDTGKAYENTGLPSLERLLFQNLISLKSGVCADPEGEYRKPAKDADEAETCGRGMESKKTVTTAIEKTIFRQEERKLEREENRYCENQLADGQDGVKKVFIKHNPYKVETKITVDGEKPSPDCPVTPHLNERFQMWVDQLPGLLAEEYNVDRFELTFQGTELDYQDLRLAVEAAEKDGRTFVTKKIDAKEYGEKEKEIKTLFTKIQRLPFEELQAPAVASAFRNALNELLEVNVVATMSAGKSTLINALLGKKLMPSKNGACTATITRIQDDDDSTFKAVVFDESKSELEHYSVLDYQTMKSLNADKRVSEIHVKGNIPFVTSDEISLVLIDTPGPDNANDKSHRLVTEKALDESSKMLVLFVMNGGKLHDDAQDAFLKKIARSMSVDGKQSKERYLFVINKMDGYDDEDDDIAGETIPETVQYLEEMGIENPNIFPAAAEPALLIRRYWSTSDEDEKKKLYAKIETAAKKLINQRQLHLEQYAHLPRSCQKEIDAELERAVEDGDMLAQALVHSGIRGIEEMIKMYVTKYSRPQKITTAVDTFQFHLEGAEAFASTEREIASREKEIEEIGARMKALEEKLESRKENREFKKKINSLDIKTNLEDGLDSLLVDVEKSLTDFFVRECPEEMDEEDAFGHIKNFRKLAEEKQLEFQAAVDRLLEKDVKEKGDRLLEEYIENLKKLSEEYSGNGLEIHLKDYVKGSLAQLRDEVSLVDDSLDTREESHTEQRKRKVEKTGRRKGWDRVFHISSWIDPTYTYTTTETYEVEVKEKVTFVSREKLTNQLIAPIRVKLIKEREKVLNYVKTETVSLKNYFEERFDEVDQILLSLTRRLGEATRSKEDAQKALKESVALLGQLDEIKKELDAILEI